MNYQHRKIIIDNFLYSCGQISNIVKNLPIITTNLIEVTESEYDVQKIAVAAYCTDRNYRYHKIVIDNYPNLILKVKYYITESEDAKKNCMAYRYELPVRFAK